MQSTSLKLFAIELSKRRVRFGYTQEEAAELLDISTRWLQAIESGKHSPNFNLTCRIAKIFNINYADFCTEEINYDYLEIKNRCI